MEFSKLTSETWLLKQSRCGAHIGSAKLSTQQPFCYNVDELERMLCDSDCSPPNKRAKLESGTCMSPDDRSKLYFVALQRFQQELKQNDALSNSADDALSLDFKCNLWEKFRKRERTAILSGSVPQIIEIQQNHPSSVSLLINISLAEHGVLDPVDKSRTIIARNLIRSCICTDLKFDNLFHLNQDLSKTLCEVSVDWTPIINQMSIFINAVVNFYSTFSQSSLAIESNLSTEDHKLLLTQRCHSAISALFTPLFNATDHTMKVQVNGRSYVAAASQAMTYLFSRLPKSLAAGIMKVDNYKVFLKRLTFSDFTLIALYSLLKLCDVGTAEEGVASEDILKKSRYLFVHIAKLLKRYCLEKYGVEKGSQMFDALVCLFEWSSDFDTCLKKVYSLVSMPINV